MDASGSTWVRVVGIAALAGLPVLLAAQPDWLASYQKQVSADPALDGPAMAEPGFVKRFNSSADGRRMLFVTREEGENRRLVLMDVTDQEAWLPIGVMGEKIRAATLSPDGLSVLIGTGDGRLAWIVLGTSTTEMLGEPSPGAAFTVTAISPDQQSIAAATGDGRVFLGDRRNGTMTLLMPAGEAAVSDLRFSRDGKRFVAALTSGSVVVWDCVTGNLLQSLSAHHGMAKAAVMTPDGEQVISAGMDGTVRIWHTLDGHEVGPARNARTAVTALDISPDGTVAAWGTMGGSIYIGNIAAGQPEREVDSLGPPVNHLKFSGDGQVLAVSACSTVIRRFEVTTGAELASLEVAPQARR